MAFCYEMHPSQEWYLFINANATYVSLLSLTSYFKPSIHQKTG